MDATHVVLEYSSSWELVDRIRIELEIDLPTGGIESRTRDTGICFHELQKMTVNRRVPVHQVLDLF
jgi:hypothetical protein